MKSSIEIHVEAIASAEAFVAAEPGPKQWVALAHAYYNGAQAMLTRFKNMPRDVRSLIAGIKLYLYAIGACQHVYDVYFAKVIRREGEWARNVPTADQVDVLCMIWDRFMFGLFRNRGRILLKFLHSSVKIDGAAKHTQAFIIMHRVRYGLDQFTDAIHWKVMYLAQKVAEEARNNPDQRQAGLGQASRMMRQLAYLMPKSDERRKNHLALAKRYAKEGGLPDQLLKLGK